MLTGSSARRIILLAFASLCLFVVARVASASEETEEVPEGTFEPVRVFEDLTVNGAYRLTPHDDGFLLLERLNHRLLDLDASGAIKRQLGRVGQGPGEMRFPMDFAVGSADTVRLVSTAGLMSIHGYSLRTGGSLDTVLQGTTPDDAEAWHSYSIALDSKGRMFLNQPRQGSVIVRYSPLGDRQLLIGELLRPGDVYPDCDQHSRCRDRRFAVRLNRVVMAVAPSDALVAAFTAAPVVSRYSVDGELEFQTRLRGRLIGDLMGVAMQEREAWTPWITENLATDGINALPMLTGVAVDSRTGLVFCLVGGRELYVLSPTGDQLGILRQRGAQASFGSVSVADGVAWFTGFSSLWRAELPPVTDWIR